MTMAMAMVLVLSFSLATSLATPVLPINWPFSSSVQETLADYPDCGQLGREESKRCYWDCGDWLPVPPLLVEALGNPPNFVAFYPVSTGCLEDCSSIQICLKENIDDIKPSGIGCSGIACSGIGPVYKSFMTCLERLSLDPKDSLNKIIYQVCQAKKFFAFYACFEEFLHPPRRRNKNGKRKRKFSLRQAFKKDYREILNHRGRMENGKRRRTYSLRQAIKKDQDAKRTGQTKLEKANNEHHRRRMKTKKRTRTHSSRQAAQKELGTRRTGQTEVDKSNYTETLNHRRRTKNGTRKITYSVSQAVQKYLGSRITGLTEYEKANYKETLNQYPWLCSLKSRGIRGLEHRCGATLLSGPPRTTVLVSAAHCNYICKDNKGRHVQTCCCRENLDACRKFNSYCGESPALTVAGGTAVLAASTVAGFSFLSPAVLGLGGMALALALMTGAAGARAACLAPLYCRTRNGRQCCLLRGGGPNQPLACPRSC